MDTITLPSGAERELRTAAAQEARPVADSALMYGACLVIRDLEIEVERLRGLLRAVGATEGMR